MNRLTSLYALRVSLLAALALVAACAPRAKATAVVSFAKVAPSPEAAPSPGLTSAERFLADDFKASTRRRCWLSEGAPLRLYKAGPTVGGGTYSAFHSSPTYLEAVVAEEHPDDVRVVAEAQGSRLLLFAEKTYIPIVPVTNVVLALSPGAPPDPAAGVRILAGTPFLEVANKDGMSNVIGRSDNVFFNGWIPTTALGQIFETAAPSPPSRPWTARIRQGATVVDSPNGARIASTHPAKFHSRGQFTDAVEEEPGAPSGYRRIRLTTPHFEIRGLVSAADFMQREPNDSVSEPEPPMEFTGHSSGPTRGTLARGARLYAGAADVAWVGVAVEPVEVGWEPDTVDINGFRPVVIHLGMLGAIDVLVRASTIGPMEPGGASDNQE